MDNRTLKAIVKDDLFVYGLLQDWDFILDGGDGKLTCSGVISRKEAILLLLVFFHKHGLSLIVLGELAKLINVLIG